MEFRIVDIKKTLKKWEKAFETTHERKASSQDIRNAPQRIQGMNEVFPVKAPVSKT